MILQTEVALSLFILLCDGLVKCVLCMPFFRVSSIIIEPYLMFDTKRTNDTRNGLYKGYVVDLMDELASVVGFRYRIGVVGDNSYGYQRTDGSWDGLVGELINDNADIAAAPLYVTGSRAEVVSFTDPFMNVFASILVHRQKMYLLSPPLSSAKDLLNQTVFRYGTLNTGVLVHAFKNTRDPDYKRIWENMKAFSPSVFTSQNRDGINRVRRKPYVYVLPSTIADYVTLQEPCDLIAIDRFLMNRHFSLALKKDSLMVYDINEGLERLRRRGTFDKLYKKWWKDKNQCSNNGGIKSSYMISSSVSSDKIALCKLHTVVLLYMYAYMVVICSA